MGLIYRVVDDGELRNEALTLARHLATQPTYGLALIKRSLNASLSNTFDEQLELEKTCNAWPGVARITVKASARSWKNAPQVSRGAES